MSSGLRSGRMSQQCIFHVIFFSMCVWLRMYVFLSPVDIFRLGTWNQLKDLEDPKLKGLAKKLPGTILHSRADSTVRKYLGAFRR